jgi:hypothetical protein
MPSIYVVMYVERQLDGTLTPPAYPMRFDLVIHEMWAQLGCVKTDGEANPDATTVTWTVQGQPFGNFAVCKLDVDAKWFSQLQAEHAKHEAVKDSLNISPSQAALKARCQQIATAINRYMDNIGVDPAESDIERAVNALLKLDFAGHHPSFGLIRESYLNALSMAPTAETPMMRHWWMSNFLLPEKLDAQNHKIDFDTLGAMRDCMTAHDEHAPCRSMHHIYQLGVLATYLSTV